MAHVHRQKNKATAIDNLPFPYIRKIYMSGVKNIQEH